MKIYPPLPRGTSKFYICMKPFSNGENQIAPATLNDHQKEELHLYQHIWLKSLTLCICQTILTKFYLILCVLLNLRTKQYSEVKILIFIDSLKYKFAYFQKFLEKIVIWRHILQVCLIEKYPILLFFSINFQTEWAFNELSKSILKIFKN